MRGAKYDGVYVCAKCFVTKQMQCILLPVKMRFNTIVLRSLIGFESYGTGNTPAITALTACAFKQNHSMWRKVF